MSNLRTHIPFGSNIPFLGIYHIRIDIHIDLQNTQRFIAMLFGIIRGKNKYKHIMAHVPLQHRQQVKKFFFFLLLRLEARASHMLGYHCVTELPFPDLLTCLCYFTFLKLYVLEIECRAFTLSCLTLYFFSILRKDLTQSLSCPI